ncbi:hypothetical protein GYMLUDRAFT_180149 [Collybiopsis luxurians FD-317 M1]|uniref:Amine oxidase domain-containing protein n=1 Tax=Collybiopsis luxurians FD-317 M1 TaxID=944289 RepID=A0A0D0C3Q4_9AGAR|nr:hypothetical protein GYMLUDRAFT_180149 [Collybiopsis luxurians FD-317 M1]
MPEGTYIPDIRTKVAQYFVNKKLQELESTNPQIKLDNGDYLQALPVNLGAATAGSSQPDNFLPLPYGQTVGWKDLYDIFSERTRRANLPAETSPVANFPGYRVAIIGAGVAGLRTAKLLQDNGIPYKIFEASTRPGGRVFTYPFSPKTQTGNHDYYDVGAMRFPDNEASKLTFELFKELNLADKLIPYVFSRDNAIMYFNGIKSTAAVARTQGDHFNDETVSSSFSPTYLNKSYVDLTGNTIYGVDACIYEAYDPFRKALVEDFDQGWEKLMEFDRDSTRAYLTCEEPQYPIPVAHWLETRASGTGGFDCAFSEAILESLEFNYPIEGGVNWSCLDGGSELLIGAMLNELDTEPSYNQRVTSVRSIIEKPPDFWPFKEFPFMQVNSVDDSTGEQNTELFTHVVSTTTFAALSTIDTTEVHMTYTQRQAIRTLLYGPAVKVAIKFTSRWWEKNGLDQCGASSYTDRLSRVVVYPSAGIGEDGPGVLMVTYNWNQDASRFGSLIINPDWSEQLDPDRTRPRSEKQLLDLIYKDLAVLHGVSIDQLRGDTLDYHVFDWYHNPYTMGAYAHFGPGQYSTLWPDIVQPAGYGRFHFAGELASANHAWVAGALDSAVRVVNEIVYWDFPAWIPTFNERHGRSSVFIDDESAHKYLVKGLFSKELEEDEAQRV